MASNLWTREDISCPVCLYILTDPTTLPCGHNFCIDCIRKCWDESGSSSSSNKVSCCPYCRETFSRRPTLTKNSMLEKMVEKLKKTTLLDTPPGYPYAGPEDVVCDVCTLLEAGRKAKAVRACRECKLSYCQSHLRAHLDIPLLQQHTLVGLVVKELQLEKQCPQHNKPLDMYCRLEMKCICSLCAVEEHKSHKTVSAETERVKQQALLAVEQRKSNGKLQMRVELLTHLGEAAGSLKGSAQAAVELNDMIFVELIHSLEKRRAEVRDSIKDREKTLAAQAASAETRLRQDITTLQRRNSDLEKLAQTQDSILFLQRWQPINLLPYREPSVISERHSFGVVTSIITEFKELLEDMNVDLLEKIEQAVANVYILESPVPMTKPQGRQVRRAHSECQPMPQVPLRRAWSMNRDIIFGIPKTRSDFLHYACQLTLDPDTAHRNLCFSDQNRKVTLVKSRTRSRLPKTFDFWEQVLCWEGLTGARYYWEADWRGKGVFIGVTYESIQRKGRGLECGLGYNVKSWSLQCSDTNYSAWHDNIETKIAAKISSPRIAVYLDHKAGTLSFYSISDSSMILLHSFLSEDFSEPLYPGFGVGVQSSLKLCELERQ
ncbi:tripartite motif-containing protein 16-like protein [Coregonus clupeaformis]|uniref:tripartite motif-containing protein 16-like protein n=1 Tax=Coregonus clupeaformis TaxID=59861 RepID=UPI001E1C4D57|nr:tripartite motif-containing protein 16-like protein [Coregonus clupeaformis]